MVPHFKNINKLGVYNDKFIEPKFKFSSRLNGTPSSSIECTDFKPLDDMPHDKYLLNDLG